jgi:chaperonin GroES
MNLRPLSDWVIVLPDKPIDQTETGILLPSLGYSEGDRFHQRGKPEMGTVVATGPGRMSDEDGSRVPVAIRAGDRVLFKRASGWDHKADGEVYHVLREGEILGRDNNDG